MTVQLSSNTAASLHHMAQLLKVKEDALLERAVKYYASALGKEMNLKEEFNSWDLLSDESLCSFEKNLS